MSRADEIVKSKMNVEAMTYAQVKNFRVHCQNFADPERAVCGQVREKSPFMVVLPFDQFEEVEKYSLCGNCKVSLRGLANGLR